MSQMTISRAAPFGAARHETHESPAWEGARLAPDTTASPGVGQDTIKLRSPWRKGE